MTDADRVSAPGATIGAIGDSATIIYGAAPAPAVWPVRVGLLPRVADQYQERSSDLALSVVDFERSRETVVLVGLGGTGKTQLAAALAHSLWDHQSIELLIWITAATRDAIISGFASAAREVGIDLAGRDSEQAAALFLVWLERTHRGWTIVLDDLGDPRYLDRLWPATNTGTVIVTTRRADTLLSQQGRRVVQVGVFSAPEAGSYFARKLSEAEEDAREELAADLGWLPLAMAQAATYINDHPGMTCQSYRARLADRRKLLASLLPHDAPADEYPLPVAATWSLSIDAANARAPKEAAGALLNVGAWLDPNGIPSMVFQTDAARTYLSAHTGRASLDQDDIDDGLTNLARFSLTGRAQRTEDGLSSVRIHALVQRTSRESLTEDEQARAATAAEAALFEAWPRTARDHETDETIATFRSNAEVLMNTAGDRIWQSAIPQSSTAPAVAFPACPIKRLPSGKHWER